MLRCKQVTGSSFCLWSVVVLSWFVLGTDGFYERGSNVISLKDQKQFKEQVLNSNFLWVVEFYREVFKPLPLLPMSAIATSNLRKRLTLWTGWNPSECEPSRLLSSLSGMRILPAAHAGVGESCREPQAHGLLLCCLHTLSGADIARCRCTSAPWTWSATVTSPQTTLTPPTPSRSLTCFRRSAHYLCVGCLQHAYCEIKRKNAGSRHALHRDCKSNLHLYHVREAAGWNSLGPP